MEVGDSWGVDDSDNLELEVPEVPEVVEESDAAAEYDGIC